MILHIPHSSTKIIDGIKISNLKENINILTDWYVDELFYHLGAEILKFDYSRIVCDVERFRENEEMDKYGMGIIYEKDMFGNDIISNLKTNDFRLSLYNKHHKKLTNIVNRYLSYFHKVLIVDCHSFSKENIMDKKHDLPDICLGVDKIHTPISIVRDLKYFFENEGFKVCINYPFSGTIFPEYFKNNIDVASIMIEVNKNVYLDDKLHKNVYFSKMANIITNSLDYIWEYENKYIKKNRIHNRNV